VESCAFCDAKAHYRDRQTGQNLCLIHARLEVVVATDRASGPPLVIRPATAADYATIGALSHHFWDETDVDCFGQRYDVLECPAFVACEEDTVVGVASYAIEPDWDAIVLVILNVLPGYQGRGGGRGLLDAVRDEAAQRDLGRVLVVTTNDELPALALYQHFGFRITEVVPSLLALDHGGEFPGLAGLPVRDEIRLEYQIVG
jgi:GNAT superfamily N-acetyltransferase